MEELQCKKCESRIFYTCTCSEEHSHHCAECNEKIYIDWSEYKIIDE